LLIGHLVNTRTDVARLAFPSWLLVFAALLSVASGCVAPSSNDEPLGSNSADLLSANDKTAYLFFLGKGLKNFQAAGIVGNLDQESEMDPTVAQFGGGPGRGIAQWSVGGRWDSDHNDNVLAYAKTKGESATSLTLQLEFVWYELTSFSSYGLAQLKNSTTLAGATVAFQTYYEGCGQCDQTTRISYAQKTLNAYGSLQPPSALKGHLDSVSCAGGIAGWAQDPSAATSAIGVDLYFDAAMGAAGAIGPLHVSAGVARTDLCGPLGSCNHGFSLGLPLAVQDGAKHAIYAYATGAAASTPDALIANAPLSITCASAAIPATTTTGVKRWIKTGAILTAWKLGGVDRLGVAQEPLATVNGYAQGPDLPATPDVIESDDGSPEVWIVDGGERRLVTDKASIAAWQLGAPTKTPAAQVSAMKQGADWPATPFVFQGEGAPQIYVLDSAPGQSLGGSAGSSSGAATNGSGAGSSGTADGNGNATEAPLADAPPGASGGGCAIGRGRDASGESGGNAAWMIAFGIAITLRRAARRSRA
jgi:hypothetical protein